MKDTVITAKRKRTEWIILLACFIAANLLNIYSIIAYKSSWTELYKSMFYVLLITFFLYFVLLFLRLIYWGIQITLHRMKRTR